MIETKVLTDHEEIRTWAAARTGVPAFGDPPTSEDSDPELLILFGQEAYEDNDQGADRPISGAPELADWDDWFKLFESHKLALRVAREEPGHLDPFHELVKR
jgi:hypothetical protein